MAAEIPIPGEITGILHRWEMGDQQALSNLASLAYPELRAIASGYLRRERSGHTLQATGLVNDAGDSNRLRPSVSRPQASRFSFPNNLKAPPEVVRIK